MEFRCAIQTVTPSMGAWGRAMQSPKAEAAALGRRGHRPSHSVRENGRLILTQLLKHVSRP